MKVHLLDMGDEKYGDSIVVIADGQSLLIDGGHIRDFESRGSAPSIPDQLAQIFGDGPPFRFDLLVVTHCHGDHIGCLPRLVEDGVITARWALLAHEDLGFPRIHDAQDGPLDDVSAKVVAALREEPRTDFMSDAALDQFLTDAANLEGNYRRMGRTLEQSCRVIRFAGLGDKETKEDLLALAREFSGIGLEIIGPTQRHLLQCTQVIDEFTVAARRAARSARRHDAALDASSLYRQLSGMTKRTDAALSDDVSQFLDRPGKGAALNNQSIVLKIGKTPDVALLTGDTQFADVELPGLEDSMADLLRDAAAAGPYAFVKLPHHGSYNGFNEAVAESLGGVQIYGIATGRRDTAHPHEDVLAILERRRDAAQFVRTDKNGRIAIDLSAGQAKATLGRGAVNDFSLNNDDTLQPEPAIPPAAGGSAVGEPTATRPAVRMVRAQAGGAVEVTAVIPHAPTRVRITIDIEPRGLAAAVPQAESSPSVRRSEPGGLPPPPSEGTDPRAFIGRLAAGRANLPKLLFVTHLPTLRDNIGRDEARQAERIIRDGGQPQGNRI